jgi:Uma2 family endonuclease
MIAIPNWFSVEEYLNLDRQPQNGSYIIRHEYRYGLVYAMAGGSDDHDEISINLIELMRRKLRGQPCSVRSGNVKVNYAESFYYYPDAFVTCDPRDKTDRYVKRYPKLIAEVLSPSTENFDRQDKFTDYQQLESLEEYVLIAQDQIWVQCRRKNQAGNWEIQDYRSGDRVKLHSIDLEVSIDDLYRGVSFLE